MSEHDANRALADTARLRMIDGAAFPYRCAFHAIAHNGTCPRCEPERDPLEDTQRMPVLDRRQRANEGRENFVEAMNHFPPRAISSRTVSKN